VYSSHDWDVLGSQTGEPTRKAPPLGPNNIASLSRAFFLSLWQRGQVLVSWLFRILVDTQIQILITGFQPLWHRDYAAFLVPTTVQVLVGIESLFERHHLDGYR
jgi:hypothetical protein